MHTESLDPTDENETPLLHSALMWDDAGLTMWRQLTDLPCYNQMWDEMELMEKHVDQIAQTFADDTVIMDLGSGYEQLPLGENRPLLTSRLAICKKAPISFPNSTAKTKRSLTTS